VHRTDLSVCLLTRELEVAVAAFGGPIPCAGDGVACEFTGNHVSSITRRKESLEFDFAGLGIVMRFLDRERCKAAVHAATRVAWFYRSCERFSIPFQVEGDGVPVKVAVSKISNPYASDRIAAILLGCGLAGDQRETDDDQRQEKVSHIVKSYHARRRFLIRVIGGNRGVVLAADNRRLRASNCAFRLEAFCIRKSADF
jgi:hypothetical protein